MQRCELSHQQRRARQSGLHGAAVRLEIGISGLIDYERLDAAIRAVVDRHEILRTRIEPQVGLNLPVQVIYESVAALENAAGEHEGAVEIDLKHDMPNYAKVSLRAPATMLDRFSCELFLKELADLYTTTLGPQATDALQYADYAAWIEESMTSADTEDGRAFWAGRDVDSFDDFSLAVVKRSPPGNTVSKVSALLDGETMNALKHYADTNDVEIDIVITSAWLVLLYRHGTTDEIACGLGSELRPFEDLKTGMGAYHQHLPLALALDDDVTFGDVVALVKTELSQMYEWQDCFSWDVMAIDQPSNIRYLIDFASLPARIVLDGTSFEVERLEYHSDAFELKLVIERVNAGKQIIATLWFDEALVEQQQAERLISQLELLIVHAVRQDDQSIGMLAMLPADEKAIALTEFNDTQASYPLDTATLVSLFQDAVAESADRPAVSFLDETITYRELDSRSNQLAHMLSGENDAGPERIVALMMDRSIHLLPAIYGVLKTGGAYLPLDSDYPDERVRYILDEANVTCVLCDESDIERFEGLGVRAVCVAALDLDDYSEAPLAAEIKPESAAYVIYTSGSTGLPKGVLNEHRSVCNLMIWLQNEFKLTVDDRVLQKTPYTFDVSVSELFWPLNVGAQLVLAVPEGHRDPGYLVDVIRRAGITTTSFVPTMLRLFLEHPQASSCKSLNCVLCAGEALVGDLKRRFQATLPETSLFNLYGPTETAVYVTVWDCATESLYESVPIGRPIANTQIQILDKALRLVPLGVKGELYIGGVQVARGYVNRDDLTSERFIDDPFSSGRLYNSGDLARWLPDGSIAYIGRADSQIKLRGLRIELGEIEEVIRDHQDVAQCVVVVWDFSETDKRLVAYLVAAEGSHLDVAVIRDHVASKVPEYMVPAHFEELSNLPTTSSGKIHRNALPEPQQTAATAEFLAPRNDVEQYLVDTWQKMLQTNDIGVRDNFFELGGDSLQAAIFCNILSTIIDSYVSVVAVFEHSTAEEFANFLGREYPAVADSLALMSIDGETRDVSDRIVPDANRPATLPLSEYQARTWFIDALEECNPAYNTMIALELRGDVDIAALRSTIRQLIDRHEILRTRYHVANGRLVQSLGKMEKTPFAVVPLETSLSDELIAQYVNEEARRTFDLEAGNVIHATLYCGTDNTNLLIVDVHQIATDAWCRHLLVNEISALYRCHVVEDATIPNPPGIQHGDFVLWNRSRLAGSVGDQAQAFWNEFLSGRTQVLDLPTDKLRSPVKSNGGANIRQIAAGSLSKRVHELSSREHVSSFMVMLAAFYSLLSKYCKQQDIVVGTTVACREREETHELMGRIANMIAVPASVDPDATFTELLSQVRENLLGALTHQEYPLIRVLNDTAPIRDLSQSPLYQVVFAGETKPWDIPSIPGLNVRSIAIDKGLAKYDMTLVVMEDGDELSFNLEYNTDLFANASMKRLLDDYEALLERLLDEPNIPLAAIQFEPASDRLSHSDKHHRINGLPLDVHQVRKALLALDPITQCDLCVHRADNRDILIAYYVGTETDSARLRQMLAWDVPASMLPAAFVHTDNLAHAMESELPVNALPAQPAIAGNADDLLKEQIIEQWRDLLAISDVAETDDFFALGGSSILALVATDRAARSFGVPITLRHFFEASNPQALADHIRALQVVIAPGKLSREMQEVRI